MTSVLRLGYFQPVRRRLFFRWAFIAFLALVTAFALALIWPPDPRQADVWPIPSDNYWPRPIAP
jgi:hypothetical protein